MATYAPDVLHGLGSLAEILSLVALDPAIWRAVATELGEPDAEDFALIAAVSPDDLSAAAATAQSSFVSVGGDVAAIRNMNVVCCS